MICEIAPAKINLTLEILNKRNDGYHEIKSVMQTIDICDVLTFWENEWIQVIPEYSNLPPEDTLPDFDNFNYFSNNLVYRAAMVLRELTGYKDGAVIQLKKNIPSSAGLGGGSSDAAATLKGLNKLWNLKLSTKELAEIGSKIGSDIPFFIYGGTCLATGRGEIIEKIKPLPKKWLGIILLPLKIPEKTKKIYSHITSINYSSGETTTVLVENIKNGHNENKLDHFNGKFENFIFNVFEMVYKNSFKEYNDWTEKLNNIINKPFHLSGSGPSIFYISNSEFEIKEIIKEIKEELNLNKYIAQTVP
ncbi:MAG: 4-(cytidine 5'-diphospho)-2-C-methyl-D-erythritol kinase [Actinobacteria bacterium]|nr:4-(cytidine 5'-diphospho)-2-C-methyl-D-erythritol kinase [Actinomycetota bacterium]